MALEASITKRIRLLIPDVEAVHGAAGDEYIFDDDDIESYYEEGFENVKCAAGLAKQAIGSAEAFIMKVVKNYETTTNGAALMREWVAAGRLLYEQGLAEIADMDSDEGIFEIVFPYESARHPEGYSHGGYRMGGWLG